MTKPGPSYFPIFPSILQPSPLTRITRILIKSRLPPALSVPRAEIPYINGTYSPTGHEQNGRFFIFHATLLFFPPFLFLLFLVLFTLNYLPSERDSDAKLFPPRLYL